MSEQSQTQGTEPAPTSAETTPEPQAAVNLTADHDKAVPLGVQPAEAVPEHSVATPPDGEPPADVPADPPPDPPAPKPDII